MFSAPEGDLQQVFKPSIFLRDYVPSRNTAKINILSLFCVFVLGHAYQTIP